MTFDDGRFEWDEEKAALNAANHGESVKSSLGKANAVRPLRGMMNARPQPM
jgi:hypothetical protein